MFYYENYKNIYHPHFIKGFSNKGKHFSLAQLDGLFNSYIKNEYEISNLTTFYIKKGCHIYNRDLYEINIDKIITLMKLGYKPRSIKRILDSKLKYNKYKEICKFFEFVDIDYTLTGIYKTIAKSFKKRLFDKKEAYKQLIEYINGNMYSCSFTEYARGVFYMAYNISGSDGRMGETITHLKCEVLPNYDKYFTFNYFIEIKECFEKIKPIFDNYFYRKLLSNKYLQKKLPNEIIDIIQLYY